MLLIARTTEALPAEERDLRDLIRTFPRTAQRPTDQWSGELKGAALEAFAAPCILDEEADLPFSPVLDLPGTPTAPRPTSTPPTPPYPRSPQGGSAMHIQQFHQNGCLLSLTTTDLALLALVLRHAAGTEALLRLSPLLPTTLDSLASAFENATLVGLHQTGHLPLAPEAPLTAEAVQAWCQRMVAEGLPDRPTPRYSTETPDQDPQTEG